MATRWSAIKELTKSTTPADMKKMILANSTVGTLIYGMCLIYQDYFDLLVALGADLPIAWEIASTEQAIIGISISLFLFVLFSFLTQDDPQKSVQFIKKANILDRKEGVILQPTMFVMHFMTGHPTKR